jgi:hypothetical protein
VDIKKFGVERPTHQVDIVSTRTIHTDEDGMPMIADDDWCLFSSKISGYSLYAKRWCYFEVDRIMEFEYDKRAYRSLALDERQKSMLVSLVKAHSEGLDFDDLIKGKGKGMIFLLHGAPGTGKTLTAGTKTWNNNDPNHLQSTRKLERLYWTTTLVRQFGRSWSYGYRM